MLTEVHLWKNDSFLDQSAFLCVFFPERDSHPSQARIFGKFLSGSGRWCSRPLCVQVGVGMCALVFPQLFKRDIFVPCKQKSPHRLIELAE